jgi:hypothetical protein
MPLSDFGRDGRTDGWIAANCNIPSTVIDV